MPTTKSKSSAKSSSASPTKKKSTNLGLNKPVQPDDKLAAIVGAAPLPRTELTKKVWEYIRKHDLQDSKQRTLINADDKLKAVFGGKSQVTMFEMTKLVNNHLVK